MRILTFAAAVLGLACAKYQLTTISTTDPGWFALSTTYTFGFDYSTVYGTGQDSTSDFILYESYGLNVASSAQIECSLAFMSYYLYSFEIDVTLFDVTPYTQYVQWVNPVALLTGDATEFDVGFKGEYGINFAELDIIHNQEFMVFAYDLADWIETTFQGTTTVSDLVPSSANWAVSDEQSFTSTILTWEPSSYLGAWYGTNDLFQYSLTGYITANV